MGRPPEDEESSYLLGADANRNPYSFMYPGVGTQSTLSVGEESSINGYYNIDNADNNNNNNNNNTSSSSGSGKSNNEANNSNNDNNSNNSNKDNAILIGTNNENYDLSKSPPIKPNKIDGSHEHKIGQILATAICGNDITSSIFYTSATCTQFAGIYAPFSLAIVCIVLYLFRKVYGEVGSALPLNGGAYNVLLNTTSKHVASLAAALTMISYVATAVVSAYTAMDYFNGLVPEVSDHYSTIVLLAIFACLNLIGIGESAIVASIIFIFHMLTLSMIVFGGYFKLFYNHNFDILRDNWNQVISAGYSGCDEVKESSMKYLGHNVAYNIYFGFGAAMLGVTGFETSSNFIEQQEQGVFPKTLRNMWAIVTFFNPLIGLLNLCYMYTCFIVSEPTGGVLANLASAIFGDWFRLWVGIDAVMVLSGSVITSYVGVTGLVRRMALDRCLPQFLLMENSCRRTNHFIILLFFLICTSLFVLADFNTNVLTGVYTIAFLGVMSLFGLGNMLLKYKRASLKREIISPWWGVIMAVMFVLAALVANVMGDPSSVGYFAIYFIVTASIILTMFIRAKLLKIVLFFGRIILKPFSAMRERFTVRIGEAIKVINSQSIVFFASKSDLAYLNKSILYIRDNEQTNWVRMIHCYTGEEPPPELAKNVAIIDRCYPKIRVDLITVHSEFNPSTVEKISNLLKIPKNFMFIACPKSQSLHGIGDYGGVRCITLM